jgi:D-sedoheptulose 7-phosphate isomerase
MATFLERAKDFATESARVKSAFFSSDSHTLELSRAADLWANTLKSGKKILFVGNGGSAADSQHLAAELVARFKMERPGLPALALTVDTSALTAISNDYDFESVYSRQVEALGQSGDLLVAISTSGNSKNILKAIRTAKQKGIQVIGMSGQSGGQMKELCNVALCVPSSDVARIQETHILIGHILCDETEGRLFGSYLK